MTYNLTDEQKNLLRRLVQEVRAGNLPEEFWVHWISSTPVGIFAEYRGEHPPPVTRGALNVLAASDLILSEPHYKPHGESSHECMLMANAFAAVDCDFDEPDTSFVTQLTPLADVTNLDDELKRRVLPILGAGSADPKLWDLVVRTAGVILEERLREVGSISDASRVGFDLVNGVFGKGGTLAGSFSLDGERQGHRDLYAGVVEACRNPYAHRLMDPLPEDGGAFIVFINLLLKMLEDLRQPTTTYVSTQDRRRWALARLAWC